VVESGDSRPLRATVPACRACPAAWQLASDWQTSAQVLEGVARTDGGVTHERPVAAAGESRLATVTLANATDKAGDGPRVTRLRVAETEREMPMTHPQAAATGAPQAAYRRLALAILGLDVPTLVTELRAGRGASTRRPQALRRAARRAA
jgi:hypothetical protein